MLILILSISGIIAASVAVGILIVQSNRISRGSIIVDPSFDGPKRVSVTLLAILRFLMRRSVHVRKFIFQYIAHVLVRIMYYVDRLTTFLYAKSRNWFVKNAVRNRGTVPHFWNHLKVYKQEMDKEKEEEN